MHQIAPLLIDPQTAGGLARRHPSRLCDSLSRQIARARLPAALIGRVARLSGSQPLVYLEDGAAQTLPEPVAGEMTAQDREGRSALPAVDLVFAIRRRNRRVDHPITAAARRRRPSGRPWLSGGAAARPHLWPRSSKRALPRSRGDMQPSQRRVFNLTGTVLHTNLGRAPHCRRRRSPRQSKRCANPTTLEYELETANAANGERPCGGLADPLDRSRGRAHRQQQCRGIGAGAKYLGGGAGDDRLTRRVDRNRRFVSSARHHGAGRDAPARGRGPPTGRISPIYAAAIGRKPA